MKNKAEKTDQTSLFLLVRNTDNVEDVIREKKKELTHHIPRLIKIKIKKARKT